MTACESAPGTGEASEAEVAAQLKDFVVECASAGHRLRTASDHNGATEAAEQAVELVWSGLVGDARVAGGLVALCSSSASRSDAAAAGVDLLLLATQSNSGGAALSEEAKGRGFAVAVALVKHARDAAALKKALELLVRPHLPRECVPNADRRGNETANSFFYPLSSGHVPRRATEKSRGGCCCW